MVELKDSPHVWLPATAEPTGTLISLHGTGADEHQFVLLREALPDYNLLAPRGRSRDEGINRWFRRLREGVFDLADLEKRSEELETFLEQAASQYRFEIEKSVWLGYSNGANILGSLLLRGYLRPKAAVLLHPMVPFTPLVLSDLDAMPLLITQGEGDPTMPPGHTAAVEELYTDSGASVRTFTHRYGHSLTGEEFAHVITWIATL